MKVLIRYEAEIEECTACGGEHQSVIVRGDVFYCPVLQQKVAINSLARVSDLTARVQ